MRSPMIQSARILDTHRILITFENDERKLFDLSPYLRFPVFEPLNDPCEFSRFAIIDGTIEWACGADLSPDTFYLESKPWQAGIVM